MEKICENCKSLHNGSFASGRFCSRRCSHSFCTKAKRKEINERVSLKLTGKKFTDERKKNLSLASKLYWKGEHPEHRSKICFNGAKNREKGKINPDKICKRCLEKGNVACYSNLCVSCKLSELKTYRWEAAFRFNVYEYPEKFDLKLIEKFGWYSASNRGGNSNGVTRDHLYSVHDGFVNKIDPAIISHPANCKLTRHLENLSKSRKSSISYQELLDRIKLWTSA